MTLNKAPESSEMASAKEQRRRIERDLAQAWEGRWRHGDRGRSAA